MRQITYRCIFSCMMHSYLVWGGAPKMGRGEKHCMEVVVAQRELELVLLKIHTFNDGGVLGSSNYWMGGRNKCDR